MSETPTRLTPAVASAFRALRHGNIQYSQFITGYSRNTRSQTVHYGTHYKVGSLTVSDQTVRQLRRLPWVDKDHLTDEGRRVYIAPNGSVEILSSDQSVEERYATDREARQRVIKKKFRKSFPKYYISPSIEKCWVCETYEVFERVLNSRLACPITGEPLIQLPPPHPGTPTDRVWHSLDNFTPTSLDKHEIKMVS